MPSVAVCPAQRNLSVTLQLVFIDWRNTDDESGNWVNRQRVIVGVLILDVASLARIDWKTSASLDVRGHDVITCCKVHAFAVESVCIRLKVYNVGLLVYLLHRLSSVSKSILVYVILLLHPSGSR